MQVCNNDSIMMRVLSTALAVFHMAAGSTFEYFYQEAIITCNFDTFSKALLETMSPEGLQYDYENARTATDALVHCLNTYCQVDELSTSLLSNNLPPNMVASIFNDLSALSDCPNSKEFFLRKGVGVAPHLTTIAKNLGYLLEQSDRAEEAAELYENVRGQIVGFDPGLELLLCTNCPPHFGGVEEVEFWHEKIMRCGTALLRMDMDKDLDKDFDLDPTTQIGQMPLSWPYLGKPMLPLMKMLGELYKKLFPMLTEVTNLTIGGAGGKNIRLGVVAEYAGNTSPGMLIDFVLSELGQKEEFELIFFPPKDLNTEFSRRIETVAAKTVPLQMYDLRKCKSLILNERIDVLVYLAIGMNPLSYYLSFSRLARVQVQFGHGHPVTSGTGEVDYFVSSDLFQSFPRDEQQQQQHSEQLVLFDTLTTSFGLESESDSDSLPLSYNLSHYNLPPGHNYYACMQYSKKIHPKFDEIIIGVLETDKKGVVLLLEGSRRHVERFKKGGMSEDSVGRLVFMERMPREELLGLVRLCDVMLGTFPWGEGVTTFEGFGVGVGTVVLPERVSVEKLTLGQIRKMGLEKFLVADR